MSEISFDERVKPAKVLKKMPDPYGMALEIVATRLIWRGTSKTTGSICGGD